MACGSRSFGIRKRGAPVTVLSSPSTVVRRFLEEVVCTEDRSARHSYRSIKCLIAEGNVYEFKDRVVVRLFPEDEIWVAESSAFISRGYGNTESEALDMLYARFDADYQRLAGAEPTDLSPDAKEAKQKLDRLVASVA